ncbi:hypothetical protein CCR75_000886 [Bremia lactucae]|uniref:Uncharacterized protein n=1 Tax=Bremia lactucae TaxID=4779 RepID=A0A976IG05_BRELC|nr:hypothetical protein CCR75_000886 [Bremia lactucae]
MHVSFDHVQKKIKRQHQRVEDLEQRQMTGRDFVERICCRPASPRKLVTSSSHLPALKRQIQSASEETSDKAERIGWTTSLSDAVLIRQDDDSSTVKRCLSVTTMSKEAA